MIVLTEVAASQVIAARQAQELAPDSFLRMVIQGGGCSGLRYGLTFDHEFNPETDTRFTQYGVDVVTRKKFAEFLDGTVIDYKDNALGRGFSIENPNFPAGEGCSGCGG
ncbi:MAG: iron-sulfur cluster assembly accessory protein [Planctomycetia bacterium]|nr:iron-sulfur cluster assembly accessory protein [Planctomycetia bacterium]